MNNFINNKLEFFVIVSDDKAPNEEKIKTNGVHLGHSILG